MRCVYSPDRVNMIETLQSDFITWQGRGLAERTLVTGMPCGLIHPYFNLLGLQLAILMAGAVLTETTFLAGMGLYIVKELSCAITPGAVCIAVLLVRGLISLLVDFYMPLSIRASY